MEKAGGARPERLTMGGGRLKVAVMMLDTMGDECKETTDAIFCLGGRSRRSRLASDGVNEEKSSRRWQTRQQNKGNGS